MAWSALIPVAQSAITASAASPSAPPAQSGPAVSGFGGGLAVNTAGAPPGPEFWAAAAAASAGVGYAGVPGTLPAAPWSAPVTAGPDVLSAGLLGGSANLPLLLVGAGLLVLIYARER